MAYSEQLTSRLRAALANTPDVEEKKMFSGVTFMVDGKMCLNSTSKGLMCRIDPALHDDLAQSKECQTVIMKGREYKGYLYIEEAAIPTKQDLNFWVELALDFNKRAKASTKKKK